MSWPVPRLSNGDITLLLVVVVRALSIGAAGKNATDTRTNQRPRVYLSTLVELSCRGGLAGTSASASPLALSLLPHHAV